MAHIIKVLKLRVSFCFPPTRFDAIINARRSPAAKGQGHNDAQNASCCVVPPVVGKNAAKTRRYPQPTTPQRKTCPLSHVCACARACERKTPLCRCAVVPYIYHLDRYRENKGKGHNKTHNGRFFAPKSGKSVVPCVVGGGAKRLKPLINNKKGCF